VSSQAFVVVAAVEEHALFVTLAQVFQLLPDVVTVCVIPGRLVGEVGVQARPVPVALDRLGTDVDLDVEVFGASLHDVAHEPELVGHVDADARAHLDFVLAAHHLAVGARDVEACLQTLEQERVGERTSEAVFAADRAVVWALRLWITVRRETEWPWSSSVQRHDALFLFDAEPWFLFRACIKYLFGLVTEVGAAWDSHVQVSVCFAQNNDVRSSSEWVGYVLDWLQKHL